MLLAAVRQLQDMVRQQEIVSGNIPHALGQLERFLEARTRPQPQDAALEHRMTIQQLQVIDGRLQPMGTAIVRVWDNVNLTLGAVNELKTTTRPRDVIDTGQLAKDIIAGGGSGRWINLDLSNVTLDNDAIRERLGAQITAVAKRLIGEGWSDMVVMQGLENLDITDAAGKVFKVAVDELFKPDGKVAVFALEAVLHSPDFAPAMDVLFGPSGKLADSAHDAATGANLDPALTNLEEKLEKGVDAALDKAGEASAAHAAEALGQKISSGATALGGALTAVPQLYDSVTKLGDAWSAPLDSTQSYMNLLSAAGTTIGQAGQTLQAFAGLTQVAAAAQAVFNAVMALNPVVLVVLAVVALIAGIALLIVYWDQVKAALRDNPWLSVAAVLLGVIGIIILIIAYWDEVKLAVLVAANFVSIQVQRIGLFFAGLATLVGQVWGVITASVANVGIAILNAFISAGTAVQNFFISMINWILGKYNELADSVIGDVLGLEQAELIPEVDVQTRLIPPREVPEIDVAAAFDTSRVTGGLEGRIAAQEEVVATARREDEERRAAAAQPAAAPAAAPGIPAPAAGLPPVPPGARPELPPAGGAAVPVGPADQSVRVEGGITVNINAERLEANAAQLLSDEIIRRIQERLGALRAEQDFRTGARTSATA
jgi:hypothetical protein